jgi:DNA-binding NtrC family response regulator
MFRPRESRLDHLPEAPSIKAPLPSLPRKSQVIHPRESGGVPGYTSTANIPKVVGGEALPVLHLLVVDDDAAVRHACLEIASKMGFVVVGAADTAGARAILKHQKIDVMLLDLKVPGAGGLTLLEEVKTLHPDTSVVVMTAFATVSSAVEAMRIGAGDYLTKPFALEELTSILEHSGERRQFDLESRRLRERLRNQGGAGHLVGRSPEMENLYRILSKVARSTHPVLILGEAGTGKELVARAIHFNGTNASKPFVPVDCGSLVPTLIESELFGYVKGAFAGAHRNKEGLLAAADGGTVFLDEISELPLELQAKLLRALQDREIRPEGATEPIPISARILAASNRNLVQMVEQGRFRKDLYFRLNVVNLRIPPLRDRREDIGLLAMHFLERVQKETSKKHALSDDALRLLTEYDWPGNVRELESAIERACALSSGPTLHMGDLPTQLQEFRLNFPRTRDGGEAVVAEAEGVKDRIVSIAEMEKQAILGTVRLLKGDKLMAAKLLGIGKTTLYRKLKEYGISDGMPLTD